MDVVEILNGPEDYFFLIEATVARRERYWRNECWEFHKQYWRR